MIMDETSASALSNDASAPRRRVTDDVKKARLEERDIKDKRRGEEGDRAELNLERRDAERT